MKQCKICFAPVDKGTTISQYFFQEDCICGDCRRKFEENDQIYQMENCRIYAFYKYNEFLEKLLFQYKEGRDVALAKVFLYLKRDKLVDMIRHRLVVCMPSSEQKIMERGFSHLEGMLQEIQLDLCPLLEKSEYYKQSEQEFKNKGKIAEIMRIKKGVKIPQKEFVLFDDVITSGNTIKAAAHLLGKQKKQIDVYVLCVHPRFVEICDENKL